jgi:hypothetical protein
MTNQNRVLFVKYRLARRLSLEKAVLFLNFGSVILVTLFLNGIRKRHLLSLGVEMSGFNSSLLPQ